MGFSHSSNSQRLHFTPPVFGHVEMDDGTFLNSVTSAAALSRHLSKRAAAVVLELPAISSRSVCMGTMVCLHGPHGLHD